MSYKATARDQRIKVLSSMSPIDLMNRARKLGYDFKSTIRANNDELIGMILDAEESLGITQLEVLPGGIPNAEASAGRQGALPMVSSPEDLEAPTEAEYREAWLEDEQAMFDPDEEDPWTPELPRSGTRW